MASYFAVASIGNAAWQNRANPKRVHDDDDDDDGQNHEEDEDADCDDNNDDDNDDGDDNYDYDYRGKWCRGAYHIQICVFPLAYIL